MSMEFGGESRLPVAREKVWAALNDPEVLRQSIAGCTELERTEDNQFKAVLTAKVGPIAVNFRGTVRLQDIVAPQSYTLVGQAQGGAAGFGQMSAHVTLEALGPDETLLRYQAQATVGGKLASVGSRLVQSVAKKTADDFFLAFAARLTGQPQVPAELPTQAPGEPPRATGLVAPAGGGGLGAPVPAWLVVFGAALGAAFGYCLALLK